MPAMTGRVDTRGSLSAGSAGTRRVRMNTPQHAGLGERGPTLGHPFWATSSPSRYRGLDLAVARQQHGRRLRRRSGTNQRPARLLGELQPGGCTRRPTRAGRAAGRQEGELGRGLAGSGATGSVVAQTARSARVLVGDLAPEHPVVLLDDRPGQLGRERADQVHARSRMCRGRAGTRPRCGRRARRRPAADVAHERGVAVAGGGEHPASRGLGVRLTSIHTLAQGRGGRAGKNCPGPAVTAGRPPGCPARRRRRRRTREGTWFAGGPAPRPARPGRRAGARGAEQTGGLGGHRLVEPGQRPRPPSASPRRRPPHLSRVARRRSAARRRRRRATPPRSPRSPACGQLATPAGTACRSASTAPSTPGPVATATRWTSCAGRGSVHAPPTSRPPSPCPRSGLATFTPLAYSSTRSAVAHAGPSTRTATVTSPPPATGRRGRTCRSR